jgi:hypothetical protein
VTTLPPARAAVLHGDDYQHIIGLYHALKVVVETDFDSVSIEDADGGAFDDVVVRPTATSAVPAKYIQVKTGMYNNVVIDSDWLTKTRTPRGKSPLQHFYKTWSDRVADGSPFELEMFSNKNYDHNDPVLELISHQSRCVPRPKLDQLASGSRGGQQLTEWAEHLGIGLEELKVFLTAVKFRHGEEEGSWVERCGPLMRLAHMRGDLPAVIVAHTMVRDWVKVGVGRRTAEEILTDLAEFGLVARDGEVVLAVHGIDRVLLPFRPNAEVDFVDLYEGDTPFERRCLREAADWEGVVLPQLEQAKRTLLGFDTKRVRVAAAMRLPMYFAVGRTFSDVGHWTLSCRQRGIEWSTTVKREAAEVHVRRTEDIDAGDDLAVVVALTLDPTDDVLGYIKAAGLPVGRLMTLTVEKGPEDDSVPGPGWAARWVRRARDEVRAACKQLGSGHVHLFMAAPAGAAMIMGHHWNMVPSTTVYDHLGDCGYLPAMTLGG